MFTDALRHLAKKGLRAATVIANFHRQRVLPLMERKLAIFQLTSKASVEGSRMSAEDLPHGIATARAKSAVTNFPSDPADLWKVKMHPKEGYISLVSLGLGCCWFYVLSSSLILISITFAGADTHWVHF